MANFMSGLVNFYKSNKILVLFMAASLTFSGISGYSMYQKSRGEDSIKVEQQSQREQQSIGNYVDQINKYLDNLIEQSQPEEPQLPSGEDSSLENKIFYK